MNKHDNKAIGAAMGPRPMDELVIQNAWAEVVIVRQDDDSFIVVGDLADTRISSKQFVSLTEAMSYALRSLAEYQHGRAD